MPILDSGNKVQSYTQLKIEKPYIALNDETYITICPQELSNCKRISDEYFCEELFVVKSKHQYSCASAGYFNYNNDIKENCDFYYYHNKTNITQSVLDGGKQIILANWPNYKRIICTYNNNIPVNILNHPYVLLDRNILCNCDIEAESNFLLESLAACDEHEKPDLEMYFTVNLAFMHYSAQLNVTLNSPFDRNWMSVKQPISISLDSFQINPKLIHAPIMLKDFMEQYQENRIKITKQENPKSKFQKFINSFLVDMLIFIAAILTIILALVIIYILTGQSKLKALITTIALQRIKAVEALNTDKPVQNCNSGLLKNPNDPESSHSSISTTKDFLICTFGPINASLLLLRKIKKSILFWGQPFSNMVKVELFLANTKSYVSLNLNQSARNMHLFKIMGELSPNNVILKKNWIWDVLEVNGETSA